MGRQSLGDSVAKNIQARLQAAGAMHQQGRLKEAQAIYEDILKSDPKQLDALHLLGIIAAQSKHFQNAADLIAKAIAIEPENSAFYYNQGIVLKELKQLEAAVVSYDRAIAIKPDYAEAYFNRGIALKELRQLEAAVESYDRAIMIKPDYAEVYSNRGIALQELNQPDAAIVSYNCAITIKPDYAGAYSNRGLALLELKQLDAAIASFDRAITIKPNFSEAYYNRGIALKELKQPEAAIANYDRAITIKPDYAEAFFNRGNALRDLKQLAPAIASYDRAIAIKPDFAEAYWNKSLALLLGGDFKNGLSLYEWRWKKGDAGKRWRSFAQPLWLGNELLKGKSILIHSEQGLGDTIQFCRYVPRLFEAGANVLFAPQKPLRGLMKKLGTNVSIVDENDPTLQFDFHAPLLSLPLAFKTNLTNIPSSIPYLYPDENRMNLWKKKISVGGFKIGICWHGGPSKIDTGRSLPVDNFYRLSKLKNVQLISLQKGEGVSQLRDLRLDMKIETLDESFDSGPDAFMDTAAVMKLCDLVITSDTAAAHLAGALGVPVWVALKFVPDWRWMVDRDDSPWYPTMQLFRQRSDGDWKGLFSEIEQSVIQLFGENVT